MGKNYYQKTYEELGEDIVSYTMVITRHIYYLKTVLFEKCKELLDKPIEAFYIENDMCDGWKVLIILNEDYVWSDDDFKALEPIGLINGERSVFVKDQNWGYFDIGEK